MLNLSQFMYRKYILMDMCKRKTKYSSLVQDSFFTL
jgi:hypothetical protein